MEASRHKMTWYQPDKYGAPADICDTCSDLDKGVLVPVSFCPEALEDCKKFYAALDGRKWVKRNNA